MDAATRIEIISAFGQHLEARKSNFGRESELPYPKELVRQALSEELIRPTMPELIDAMEVGFVLLESFVSDAEYAVVQRFEQVVAQGQLLKQSGDINATDAFVKEAKAASDPMLTIMKRTSSLEEARRQQLLKMRTLRQRETR
jgi:hypothetical protein